MADNTAISWTDSTWNPLRGCSRVSAGCVNCYAERQAVRHSGPGRPYEGLVRMVNGHPTWTGQITLVPEALDQPLRWRKPRRIFVNSMSDLFHEDVTDDFIAAVFGVMAACPQHTFQVLTKRPERMRDWFLSVVDLDTPVRTTDFTRGFTRGLLNCCWEALRHEKLHHPLGDSGPLHTKYAADPEGLWPLPNVHLGVSVEDQASADERIPLLLQTPAAVRWVSAEPLLGPIGFEQIIAGCVIDMLGGAWVPKEDPPVSWACTGLDWVVVGGESGPGARPCDVQWIRSAVQQCKAAGVPVFVKQLGVKWYVEYRSTPPIDRELFRSRDRKGANPAEWPRDLRVQEFPS